MYYDGLCLSMQIVEIDSLPLIKRDYSLPHTPAPHACSHTGESWMDLSVHRWVLRKRCFSWIEGGAGSSSLAGASATSPISQASYTWDTSNACQLHYHGLLNYSGTANGSSEGLWLQLIASVWPPRPFPTSAAAFITSLHTDLLFTSLLKHFSPFLGHEHLASGLQWEFCLSKGIVLSYGCFKSSGISLQTYYSSDLV